MLILTTYDTDEYALAAGASRTVKTHMARVLGPLDLRDRGPAAIFAHQSGLR